MNKFAIGKTKKRREVSEVLAVYCSYLCALSSTLILVIGDKGMDGYTAATCYLAVGLNAQRCVFARKWLYGSGFCLMNPLKKIEA